ncbi:MAG: hypothetical protein B7Z37_26000 [Verrucomicrobia bacterium 12-59-8]|nr:MAG: hypothetical protein B7Z37_26000 [Verrucomicrobia bacterium 12-59-8]
MKRRIVLVLVLGALTVLLACCDAVRTVSLEYRLFVRVPGADIQKAPKDSGGWSFRHVVEGPVERKTQMRSQWYLAYQHSGRRKILWHFPLTVPWRAARGLVPELADACKDSLGAWPQLIEPSLIFNKSTAKVPQPSAAPPDGKGVPVVQLTDGPCTLFPWKEKGGYLDPVWHLDDEHSQLASARERVRQKFGYHENGIRIGILDTGFDARHVARPKHLAAGANLGEQVDADAMQALRPEYDKSDPQVLRGRATPGQSLGSHGMGSLGLLAARPIKLVDTAKGKPRVPMANGSGAVVEYGAAPDAEIVPVRIAPWVASLSTANVAYGIDYASRRRQCDVISMSNGGSPSMMWADAVNAAYDRGTAIFAATGDYFAWPAPGRLGRMSIVIPPLPIPPSSTVYPAGFRRVMAVAGVTASEKSYALTDWPLWFKNIFKRSNLSPHILMRGSYGADGVRRSLWDGSLSDERTKTDKAMVRRNNELRANPICAYTHAVPWLTAGKVGDRGAINQISLDGAGTSSSAPQAAAAAAHWLAMHRKEIEQADHWHDWQKAEAVYVAMVLSAQRDDPTESKPENQSPSPFKGAGVLRAASMLDITFAKAKSIQGETLSWPHNSPGSCRGGTESKPITDGDYGVPRDFYDAERSYYGSVINGVRQEVNRSGDRAEFRSAIHADREAALKQCYFNMLLLDKWQNGRNPLKPTAKGRYSLKQLLFNTWHHEPQLDREASNLARKATPQ